MLAETTHGLAYGGHVSRSSLIGDQPVELIGDQTTSKAINLRHQVVLVVGLVEIKLVQDRVPGSGVTVGGPPTFTGVGRAGQLAIAGRLTAGSSLNGAMVSRVM